MAGSDWLNQASTSELLCLPFLDSGMSDRKAEANAILVARGYSPWQISLLRKLCRIGLWTQYFVWEEWRLDILDVVLGYGLLFVLLAIACIVFGFSLSKAVAWIGVMLFILGCVLTAVAWAGFRRNNREKLN
jgi:small-conductance mechanosensitive channel